jgi:signal transduction histidine kinase
LRIRDDGRGIDSQILASGQRRGHWGLPGMRERAKQIGGTLDVWSRANAGTEIDLNVPGSFAYGMASRHEAERVRKASVK